MSATNRGATRVENDYYGTPAWATEAILVQVLSRQAQGCEDPILSVLEPCAGTGAIVKVLKEIGYNPHCVEIDPTRAASCRAHAVTYVDDFLKYEATPGQTKNWDLILTNPPFSLALAFVEKSLTVAKCTIMLLPLNFMSSKGRVNFHAANPAHVHVLPKRPSFGLNKHGKPGTDAQDYAWFQWGGPGYVPGRWEILATD